MNKIIKRVRRSLPVRPPSVMPPVISNDRQFSARISSELLRLSRGNAELSLICATLCEPETLLKYFGTVTTTEIETVLYQTLYDSLEECDSINSLCPGHYALMLPGVGLLKARLVSERLQDDFAARIRRGNKFGAMKVSCALSIVCVSQDDQATTQGLIARAEAGLCKALAQKSVHIFQEAHTALDARAALVNPNEKRFLFFGGGE